MQYFRDVYDRLGSSQNRLYVGGFVGLLALTGMVGCLVLYQFINAGRNTAAPLDLAPKAVEITAAELTFVPVETATLEAAQELFIEPAPTRKPTAKPKPTAGASCYYSSAWLNQDLEPVASGSWSPVEHYLCKNGYWEIGEGDVVNRKTGGWGQDGVVEKILIKYDSNGNIADRIFIDPDGNQFTGPKN